MRNLLIILCLLGLCTAATAQKKAPKQTVFVYWVSNDDGHVPTECEFKSCGSSALIEHGQPAVPFDVRIQTTDRYIFLAEPITEPVKSHKYAGTSDYERLGPNGQFSAPVRLGGLRYYRSNAPTSNKVSQIQLIAE